MFDLRAGIGLPDVILVDDEVVAPQIRNKVAVEILHQQLQSYQPRGRIEMNLRSLFALLADEQRVGRTIRDLDLSIRCRMRRRFVRGARWALTLAVGKNDQERQKEDRSAHMFLSCVGRNIWPVEVISCPSIRRLCPRASSLSVSGTTGETE